MFHAACRGIDGEPDGYVSYRMETEWVNGQPRLALEVVELLAATADSYVRLWRHCLDLDLVHHVTCPRGRVDEPLRWLLVDPRQFQVRGLIDHLWLRPVEVASALEARTYRTCGELTLGVADLLLPDVGGRYRLAVEHVENGGASCVRTNASPDLEVDIADLGSVYLGDVSFATLAEAGRVKSHSVGAVALADRLFATAIAPYCNTKF